MVYVSYIHSPTKCLQSCQILLIYLKLQRGQMIDIGDCLTAWLTRTSLLYMAYFPFMHLASLVWIILEYFGRFLIVRQCYCQRWRLLVCVCSAHQPLRHCPRWKYFDLVLFYLSALCQTICDMNDTRGGRTVASFLNGASKERPGPGIGYCAHGVTLSLCLSLCWCLPLLLLCCA